MGVAKTAKSAAAPRIPPKNSVLLFNIAIPRFLSRSIYPNSRKGRLAYRTDVEKNLNAARHECVRHDSRSALYPNGAQPLVPLRSQYVNVVKVCPLELLDNIVRKMI